MNMTKERALEVLQRLFDDLDDDEGYREGDKDYEDTMFALDMAINALQKEEKVGHWIENEKQTHIEKMYHCSECGFEAWGKYECTNYCGNCGCRMEEVSE